MIIPKLSGADREVALRYHTDRGMILRTFDYHEAENRYVIHSTQECDPIIRSNLELFNCGDGGYGPTKEWKRAARVPNLIIEQWMKMGINAFRDEDTPKILAMLDSPEWKFLRTAPGRLSRRPYRHYLRASTVSGTQKIPITKRIRLAA